MTYGNSLRKKDFSSVFDKNTNLRPPKKSGGLSLTGFTLIELMIAVGILAFCLTGLLLTYIGMLTLNETARNLTVATNAAQTKLEELRNQSFTNLDTFNGNTFDVDGFAAGNAKGRIEVGNVTGTTYGDLKEIRIIICWRQRGARIIGEDTNLNGVLNTGEDKNNNTRLDSPCEVASFIAQ